MKNILFVFSRVIYPPIDGGRKCMYWHLRTFAESNLFNVHALMGNKGINDKVGDLPNVQVLAFDKSSSRLRDASRVTQLKEIWSWFVSFSPRQAQALHNPAYVARTMQYIVENNIETVILETPYVAAFIDMDKLKSMGVKIVTIAHNVEYEFVRDCLEKCRMRGWYEINLTKKYEQCILSKSDVVIALSPYDKNKMEERFLLSNIVYLPTIMAETDRQWNGIASNYILFCGALDFYPNYHGFMWFLESVWKRYVVRGTEMKLLVTGKLDEGLKNKMAVYRNVSFTGFLEQDELEQKQLGAAFEIVPIFKGSGIKIKLLEALSHGIPVIGTPHCFDGAPFDASSDVPYIVAGNAEDFLCSMEKMRDAEFRKKLGSCGKEYISRKHQSEENKKSWYNLI